jgi:hypothetical protein
MLSPENENADLSNVPMIELLFALTREIALEPGNISVSPETCPLDKNEASMSPSSQPRCTFKGSESGRVFTIRIFALDLIASDLNVDNCNT